MMLFWDFRKTRWAKINGQFKLKAWAEMTKGAMRLLGCDSGWEGWHIEQRVLCRYSSVKTLQECKTNASNDPYMLYF